jgi:hypothetical protein
MSPIHGMAGLTEVVPIHHEACQPILGLTMRARDAITYRDDVREIAVFVGVQMEVTGANSAALVWSCAIFEGASTTAAIVNEWLLRECSQAGSSGNAKRRDPGRSPPLVVPPPCAARLWCRPLSQVGPTPC